jgi:hypothetical protein
LPGASLLVTAARKLLRGAVFHLRCSGWRSYASALLKPVEGKIPLDAAHWISAALAAKPFRGGCEKGLAKAVKAENARGDSISHERHNRIVH